MQLITDAERAPLEGHFYDLQEDAQDIAARHDAHVAAKCDALARDLYTHEEVPLNSLGQPKFEIPTEIFLQMERVFGHGCWNDKGFRDSFFKKNPQFRCRVKPRRTTLVVDGYAVSSSGLLLPT